MADKTKKPRRLKEIVEESQYWDAHDLLRNFEEEMERFEQGQCHMIWDADQKPVTKRPKLLPIAPRFDLSEDDDSLRLNVELPGVAEDQIHLDIDSRSIEILACCDELTCRPYYLSVVSRTPLDTESAQAAFHGAVLKVELKKSKKKRLTVK